MALPPSFPSYHFPTNKNECTVSAFSTSQAVVESNDAVPVTVLRKRVPVCLQALRVPHTVPSPVRAPSRGTPTALRASRLCRQVLCALSSPHAGLSFNVSSAVRPHLPRAAVFLALAQDFLCRLYPNVYFLTLLLVSFSPVQCKLHECVGRFSLVHPCVSVPSPVCGTQ